MDKDNLVLADRIAQNIKHRLSGWEPDHQSSIRISVGTHLVLEAVAEELGLEKTKFKEQVGVGNPLAYFI